MKKVIHEQHRQEGRHYPVIPHKVPNVETQQVRKPEQTQIRRTEERMKEHIERVLETLKNKSEFLQLELQEKVEQIDEISLKTMKSAKEKLADKAVEYHYDDNKHYARAYASRALNMGNKIRKKEMAMKKEEVEQIDESASHEDVVAYADKKLKGWKKTVKHIAKPRRMEDGDPHSEYTYVHPKSGHTVQLHQLHANKKRTQVTLGKTDKVGDMYSHKGGYAVTEMPKNSNVKRHIDAALEKHNQHMNEEVEQIDEISTGKKMAVAYRAGKRYIDAKKQDDYLTKIGAHSLVAADVSDKKKHINTIKRSGTMGKLASVAGAIKKTYAEEVEQIDEVDMGQAERGMRTSTTHSGGYHVVHAKSGKVVSKHTSHGDAIRSAMKHGLDDHEVKAIHEEVEQSHEEWKNKARKLGARRFIKTDTHTHAYNREGKQVAVTPITKEKVKEEVEQIDELSKKTLGNYVAKAVVDVHNNARWAGEDDDKDAKNKAFKRLLGVKSAASRLSQQVVPGGRINHFRRNNEEVELDEAATRKEVKKVYSKKGNHIGTVYHVDNGKDKPFISAEYHHGGGAVDNRAKSHEDAEKSIHSSHEATVRNAKGRHAEAKKEYESTSKYLKSIPESVEQIDENWDNQTLHVLYKAHAGFSHAPKHPDYDKHLKAIEGAVEKKHGKDELSKMKQHSASPKSAWYAKAKLPEEVEQIDELSKGLLYRYFKKSDKGGSEKRYAGMKLAAQKAIPMKSSAKIQGTGELDPAKEDKRMKEEVELEEGNKENKQKLRTVDRTVGKNWNSLDLHKTLAPTSPLRMGRAVRRFAKSDTYKALAKGDKVDEAVQDATTPTQAQATVGGRMKSLAQSIKSKKKGKDSFDANPEFVSQVQPNASNY